jgi:hypothetical protein
MEQEFENEKALLELNRDLGFENSTIFFGNVSDEIDEEEENIEPETETTSVFDIDSENEFSEFVGKKSRERRKVKKELKKTGLSNKEARKQALEEVGRGKIGKGVLKVALAPVRGAFLSLLLLNFRGLATKIMAIDRGTQADVKKKLVSAWENRLGGDYDELIKAAEKAENKKPFFCGKKCKLKVVEKASSNSFLGFVGKSGSIYDNFSNVAGGDDLVIAAWIGLAGTGLGVIGGVANNAQLNKGKKAEIEAAERMADKELATLTANQKAQIEAAEKRLQAEGDPKKAILNNPDLTAEEKKASLDLLEKTESQSDTRNIRKILMIGVPVALLLGIGAYFLTRKK